MILNLIFPIYLLWFFPTTWIFIIIGNFIIDFGVIYVTCKILHINNFKEIIKKSFFITYLGGFIIDIIGSLILVFFPSLINLFNQDLASNLSHAAYWNPFSNISGFLFVLIVIIMCAYLIWYINYHFAYRKLFLAKSLKFKLSMSIALITAPYLFFLPTYLFSTFR